MDIDDYMGENHLQIINDNFGTYDWVWYDHYQYNPKSKQFEKFTTNIDVYGRCGTSSISHKRSLGAMWYNNDYSHDFKLINLLKSLSPNYGQIPCTEYMVCHNPNGIDI
jgi:hypothetical protein